MKNFNGFVLFSLLACFLGHESFAKEIRRISAKEFNGETERFYREFAQEPVIIEEAYGDDDELKSLTLDRVEDYFKDRVLYGYNRKNDETGRVREEIPGPVFFADLKRGASSYYVFDHEVSESPFAGQLAPPSFLGQNWLGEDHNLSLTLSGKGSFTPFHEDGSGEQAWMYLVTGEKHWVIYPPQCRPLVWDSLYKDFFNPRKSDRSRFPYLSCADAERLTAVARAGDLIFLPPGWIHQVLTTEDSFGIGGNIVNEFQALASVATGLNEKSHALRHDFDLTQLVLGKRGQSVTEYGQGQVNQAIELIEVWSHRIRDKSDQLVPLLAGVRSESGSN